MQTSRKKKIAIIGAGNSGCITALHYHHYGKEHIDKITIYHDPEAPIERVGQGTTIEIASLLYAVFGFSWYDQFDYLRGTRKSGVLYEGWGKKEDKIFHKFPLHQSAIHYIPNLLTKLILTCGLFEVVEKSIRDPESEIDADYIFDCRGKNYEQEHLYDDLVNPLNSAILARDDTPDPSLDYTRCVATPDGWTFVIPNYDSVSFGYLFNDKVTDKKDAAKNLIDIFGVIPDGHLKFKNYMAKNFFVGERTILNGNRGMFIEPLEATSGACYWDIAKYSWDHIIDGQSKDICNLNIRNMIVQVQDFILWHYQFGSKYDTPFWRHAKSLSFNPDEDFNRVIELSKTIDLSRAHEFNPHHQYSQWHIQSFASWILNV